jgi:hypothetical protein
VKDGDQRDTWPSLPPSSELPTACRLEVTTRLVRPSASAQVIAACLVMYALAIGVGASFFL